MDFPYGNIVSEVPPGITPPETWSEFGLLAGPAPICRRELVGTEPKGVRWSLWPMTFEEYISDTEPNLVESKNGSLARNRIIMWKRIRNGSAPSGWRQTVNAPWRIDGFHELGAHEKYLSSWHHNARRDAKLWRERHMGRTHAIEEISLQEFEKAYRKSTAWKKGGSIMFSTFVRRLALPERKGATKLWGVRDLKTNEIIAGTAALFSSAARASVRECPFMLPEAREVYAATGLIDHWFARAAERNIKTLFFTHFWHPGETQSWKGFSEFKSHFGLQYVAYSPLLWRFEQGSLF